MIPKRRRLDTELVARGLIHSREKAQALIIAGHVLVNDTPASKPGHAIQESDLIRLRNVPDQYVARSAHKLIHALDHFQLSPQDSVCLDVGSSTGGFTQVLLERGAKKVYAVDVGTQQLDFRLRSDPRIFLRENTHVKDLKITDFPEPLALVTIDVSFISLRLVLPLVKDLMPDQGLCISLFKPQFEVGAAHLKKGIVKDTRLSLQNLEALVIEMKSQNLVALGSTPSSVLGSKGNQEYLILWQKNA
jgi:23S rRNA (cytidine1920-2'-O)/16S rRNA (cytidine1409-2'-O)-methyltransferase